MKQREHSAGRLDPGALVMVSIQGKVLDSAQAAFLRRNSIRAVVLFRANLGSEAEVRALTAALRKTMGPRALIAHRSGRRRSRPRNVPAAPACGDGTGRGGQCGSSPNRWGPRSRAA